MAKATILLADNDLRFSEARAELLRLVGYQVFVALNPAEVKDIAERGGIDLVILDLRLTDDCDARDISGLSVAKEISPLIPKIIMTAYPMYEIVLQALRHNVNERPLADEFLAKQEGPERLLSSIERIIAKARASQSPKESDQDGITRTTKVDTGSKSLAAIRILFLASNPRDTAQLRLDEEMRAIDQALVQTEFRSRFDIKQHWAVRILDIQGYLLRHKPDIVHFSGHGCSSSEIILEDNLGNSRPVSARALSTLFSVLKDNIRLVILNACYSEAQANAIAEHIDCVVGMSRSITDPAAIAFSAAFYQGLGYGRDVSTAFKLGCAQIDLENLDEHQTPTLLAPNCNPKDLIFVAMNE